MTVTLLGVPYDTHSSFLRGPAEAPPAIRRALTSGSANWCAESGVDLDPLTHGGWRDGGDLELPDEVEPALALIREAAAAATADGSKLLSLGGDHLVTWPLASVCSQQHDSLTVLHFDAHPDLYDSLDGDRYSHACPFARLMEEGRVGRLVQLGIRTATPHQREQADRFGVEMIELGRWDRVIPSLEGPVYVTIDLDALDPAFAPGVSHHEPGGMSTRELLDSLQQLTTMDVDVVGADIVELNPTRDLNDTTAMVAAKLVRELLDLMV